MVILSKHSNYLPELLAPAGTREALLAALGSGADAVYLGLDAFNARSNAANFTLETLPEACDIAHAMGARVYLAANVVILPHEMQEVVDLIDAAWGCGVDAVIIQDLGLIRVVSEVLPQVRIHASTQMNIHSSESIRALARYGVKRVTLARETSLREITTLVAAAKELDMEVESFGHGAICVSYSGQCLLSSLIGRRSANRGQCAQPCRLPYELVDKQGQAIETEGTHLLSPKDLASIGVLDDLVKTGVASIKIEGRMKSADYVASVVSVYRKAIDEHRVDDLEDAHAELAEAFSRGFSTAYLTGERGNAMMSFERPNNRGVAVGRIVAFDADATIVEFNREVVVGDKLEVYTGSGRFNQDLKEAYVDGEPVDTIKPKQVAHIIFTKRTQIGDRVFRIRSANLSTRTLDAIALAEEFLTPLDFNVEIVEGKPLSITVTDKQGVSATATGDVVEPARTKALEADDVRAHVDRLGGTHTAMNSFEITLGDNVGLGFSALHRVRREAVEAYKINKYFNGRAREPINPYLPGLTKVKRKGGADGHRAQHIDIVAVTDSIGGANAGINAGAHEAHVAAYNLVDVEPVRGVAAILPRVAHDNEIDEYLGIAERFGSAVCSTLGQLKACQDRSIPAQAHWSLNATNAYTVAALADMGATRVWLSPELSGRQIAEIAAFSAVPVGIAVTGLAEVMVTEHCVLMAMGPCNQDCPSCKRRNEPVALKDRKDYHFRAITDPTGRSHIYNSVPLDISDSLDEIVAAGVGAIRLDLETALTSSVSGEVARVRQTLTDTLAGRSIDRVDPGFTRGHFFRGIL